MAADAVSERFINIDANVGKYKLCLTSAYMPHGGYPDSEVECIYVGIENVKKEVACQKTESIVAGEWNAEVGARQWDKGTHIIGGHGVGKRNVRGQLLADWSGCNGVVLTNTLFRKRWEHQWAHEQDGRRRVIDYTGIRWELRRDIKMQLARSYASRYNLHRGATRSVAPLCGVGVTHSHLLRVFKCSLFWM